MVVIVVVAVCSCECIQEMLLTENLITVRNSADSGQLVVVRPKSITSVAYSFPVLQTLCRSRQLATDLLWTCQRRKTQTSEQLATRKLHVYGETDVVNFGLIIIIIIIIYLDQATWPITYTHTHTHKIYTMDSNKNKENIKKLINLHYKQSYGTSC